MENYNFDDSFIPPMGVVRTDTFSKVYPMINTFIMDNCKLEKSRDGEVRELLDFKTQLLNPYRRCVGGWGRDINVFFLLAEAMWISMGRKDVNFLTIFNKQMKEYSDDGKVFHAPYGYRLRHWGIASEMEFTAKAVENNGFDQVVNAIRLLAANPLTRQVVMEIWNPSFDLGHATKDLPCNDIVMLKIRDGKLITTIGNRSNDLHWGLPTNIFQFSFLTELMSLALGVELGTQTHNSQSLHIYSWNEKANVMYNRFKQANHDVYKQDLYYGLGAFERKIDFKFVCNTAVNKFKEIEYILDIILSNIETIANGGDENKEEIETVASKSEYLYRVYSLLKIYVAYKRKIAACETDEEKDAARRTAISYIEVLTATDEKPWDIAVLAKNFFQTRLSSKESDGLIGLL